MTIPLARARAFPYFPSASSALLTTHLTRLSLPQYYAHYAPENMDKAHEASNRFSGDRQELNMALKGKYGVSLDEYLVTIL